MQPVQAAKYRKSQLFFSMQVGVVVDIAQ